MYVMVLSRWFLGIAKAFNLKIHINDNVDQDVEWLHDRHYNDETLFRKKL